MRAILIVIALAACGGSKPAAPPPAAKAPVPADAAVDAAPVATALTAEGAIAKMSRFSDEMCKCTDRACTTRVTDELTTWGQEVGQSNTGMEKVTEAQVKQMADITERMTKCMTEVMTKSAGSGAGAPP